MRFRAMGLMLTLAILVTPLAAEAQSPPKVPRIGVLSAFSFTTVSRSQSLARNSQLLKYSVLRN